MKRIFSLIIVLLVCGIGFAQTQQGIVKTRGRMVNGKLVAGQRLTGATITLNFGNPLVSGSNGTFSFNVPSGKNYSLVTAKKQGYTLADPEYTRRSFKYSAGNPFYVVLEDEAQRQADVNAARRNIQNTMSAQLKQKEKEIEALKQQKTINEQEYERRIAELYDAQDKSYELVKKMAERYASTDYDQLDEFNQQIQMYIESGELIKADSMIQTKGSIEKRIEEYHQVVAANKEERKRLEQSESGAAKTYEELSADLFNKHTIAMQQYEWDDALMFLKQRADLDTTNYYAVWRYAELSLEQQKFAESLKYWVICLRISNDLQRKLPVMVNMCNVFYQLREYKQCAMNYREILHVYELLSQENSKNYREDIANVQMNLGSTYISMGEYENAKEYLELALITYDSLFRKNPEVYREPLAMLQNNLGLLYANVKDNKNSEKHYLQSLENYEILCKQDPGKYRPGLARTQANMGLLYNNSKDYVRSLEFYNLAVGNYEELFRQNLDAYRVDLANTQNSLGVLYKALGNFEDSEKYYQQSLENKKHLFRQYPNAYRGDLAITEYNIGNLYKDYGKYSQAEKLYKSAIEKFETQISIGYDIYHSNLTSALINLGDIFLLQHDYPNAIKYHESGWKNLEFFYRQAPEFYRADAATLLVKLGSSFGQIDDYDNYARYLHMASESFDLLLKEQPEAFNAFKETFLGTKYGLVTLLAGQKKYQEALEEIDKTISMNPDDASLYDLKGSILLAQNKSKEAQVMWKKVLELNPDFMKNYPDGTNLSNELKKLGLIE